LRSAVGLSTQRSSVTEVASDPSSRLLSSGFWGRGDGSGGSRGEAAPEISLAFLIEHICWLLDGTINKLSS
jgi:hypothetical protein